MLALSQEPSRICWNIVQKCQQPLAQICCKSSFVPTTSFTRLVIIAHEIGSDFANMSLNFVCPAPAKIVVRQELPLEVQVGFWNDIQHEVDHAGNPCTTKTQMNAMPQVKAVKCRWVILIMVKEPNKRWCGTPW